MFYGIAAANIGKLTRVAFFAISRITQKPDSIL